MDRGKAQPHPAVLRLSMRQIMKKQKSNNTENLPPRRRLLNIGPGLILALIISTFIGIKWIDTQRQAGKQTPIPPIVESQIVSSSYEGKVGPTPEIKFAIDRASKLGLSRDQLARLNKLQSDWEKFYGPKIAEANKAAQQTSDYLADAKKHRRTPVAQIQNEAGAVIALSAEISSAHRSYWDRTMQTLTPEQRVLIQKEREAAWQTIKR